MKYVLILGYFGGCEKEKRGFDIKHLKVSLIRIVHLESNRRSYEQKILLHQFILSTKRYNTM